MFLSHLFSSVARICCVSSAIGALITIALSASPAGGADWPSVEVDPAEAKIEGALQEDTSLEFIETPLQDVVSFLKDLHGIEIQIDTRALEDVGIGSDTPITRDLKGISLRSALRLTLKELDLTYVVRDEVLLITTPEEVESDTQAYVQVYNVQPLLDEEHGVDELIDTVKMAFEKDSTVQVSTFRSLLVVRATSRQHRQARRLLGVIGAALDVTPPKSIAERDRERPLPMGLAPPARRDDVAPARDPFDDGAGDPFAGGADPFDPFGE